MLRTLYHLIKALLTNKVSSLKNEFEFIDKISLISFGKKYFILTQKKESRKKLKILTLTRNKLQSIGF